MAEDPRNEPTPEQLLAAQQAEREQALASAPESARGCRVLFDAFEAEGFNSDQALYLTAIALVNPDFKAP